MRGLVNVVLLVIGVNTILSLSLPVIEGDTLNTFSSEDEDATLGLPHLEMLPQFDPLNAGSEHKLIFVSVSLLSV